MTDALPPPSTPPSEPRTARLLLVVLTMWVVLDGVRCSIDRESWRDSTYTWGLIVSGLFVTGVASFEILFGVRKGESSALRVLRVLGIVLGAALVAFGLLGFGIVPALRNETPLLWMGLGALFLYGAWSSDPPEEPPERPLGKMGL